MKKKIISTLCISAFLVTGSVHAATFTKSLKGLDINVKAPTVSVPAKTTTKTSVNKAAMKANISSINSKVNSVSSNYQSAVNNLANNLLPKEQLKKYNEEKEKIKSQATSNASVNIEIAENGTVSLNKYVKSSSAKDTFKNLTTAQKTAIKKDLKNLQNVSASYSQIAEQSKTLAKQIKADPGAALELKTDLTDMVKNEVKVTKQVKNIAKLSKSITTSAAKAGVSL